MVFVASIATLLVGLAVGWFLASMRSRSDEERDPTGGTDRAVVVPGEERDDSIADLGLVLRLAANELDLGVVVGDSRGKIVYRNRTATEIGDTHTGVLIESHLDSALDRARVGGRADETIEMHGPPRQAFRVRAEPMEQGFAVATFEDVSERIRIDSMRTDFVANISHELKTPVGAIAVLADALDGSSDPELIERVRVRLASEAHRAAKSIDDLLELARIETGTRLNEAVQIDDVVHAAIERARDLARSSDVSVSAFDARNDITVRGDARQLESAIGNLVENAVKYSDPGGLVQVRTRVDDRFVEIMVADQGIGIPQRDLDRIFERFYRVDRARSRSTGGSGLGLSIVRHVAQNHGGEVLVSSQEGEGTTFVLRLPAALLMEGDDAGGHRPLESGRAADGSNASTSDDASPAVTDQADRSGPDTETAADISARTRRSPSE